MTNFEYLATPYSNYPAGLEEAYHDALVIVADLFKRGLCVYSPIVHTHPIARTGNIDPMNLKIWIPFDEPFMHAASALIIAMLPGWAESNGVNVEIAYFTATGKPIRYYDPEKKSFL